MQTYECNGGRNNICYIDRPWQSSTIKFLFVKQLKEKQTKKQKSQQKQISHDHLFFLWQAKTDHEI